MPILCKGESVCSEEVLQEHSERWRCVGLSFPLLSRNDDSTCDPFIDQLIFVKAESHQVSRFKLSCDFTESKIVFRLRIFVEQVTDRVYT